MSGAISSRCLTFCCLSPTLLSFSFEINLEKRIRKKPKSHQPRLDLLIQFLLRFLVETVESLPRLLVSLTFNLNVLLSRLTIDNRQQSLNQPHRQKQQQQPFILFIYLYGTTF